MKINFGEIVSAGQSYIDALYRFRREYPGHNYISHADPALYEAYHAQERAERALTTVCYVLEIPANIPIQAARIINRAYERAYAQGRDPGIIDEAQVIRSLLANQ